MDKKTDRIVNFIKDYVKEANKDGVVLGLSGGLDSAVVAVLAKKALGSKNVHCRYLPYEVNKFDDKHIFKLCKRFDLVFDTMNISKAVDAIYLYPLEGCGDKKVLGNIKARIRMVFLYMEANMYNCLVIGTGNKSEIMTGYFTKYGDGGVDFEPIAHLYKTEVFKMAKFLDIPNEIIDKPPTAGLWEGQTDEGELGLSYETLDKILKYKSSFKTHNSEQLAHRVDCEKDDVELVKYLVSQSEHKRNERKRSNL